jgi:AraC-like DNA-binding protein
MTTTLRRRDGFEGEKYISIPESAWKSTIANNPIMSQLYVTSIGYFPKASYHFRQRLNGCTDNIIIYCVRGKGWFKLDNQYYPVGPNEFIIVPATKVKMSYGADETDPWTIYWIHFSGKDMDAFNQTFNIKITDGARPIIFNEKGIQIWENIYQNLQMGYSIENLTNTNLCLYHFLATFLYPDKHSNGKVQEEKDMIKDTINYLQQNLQHKVKIDDIAHKNGFSASHFSNLFKKATGMAPLDYFIHLKLQRACVLLYSSEIRIKELAILIGYDDPFHFSRLFKKNMKVSPNQYRILRRKTEVKTDT